MITPIDSASVFYNDRKYISFFSHDYLGLSDHTEVKKSAIKFLLQYGMCATSFEDPVVTCFYQKQLEEKFASLLGKERVFFSTAPPLISLENVVFAESVHSIGGHFSQRTTKPQGTLLCVDDSHSFALFGKEGMGLSAHQEGIDLITGSLSMGCGVFGFYVACNQHLAERLQRRPDHFPSPIIGALDAAFELIPHMEGERAQLKQRAHYLRTELQGMGLVSIPSTSPLVALPFASKEEAEDLRKHLFEAEILIAPAKELDQRFVLQFPLTSAHLPDHLGLLLHYLKIWKEALVAG